MTIGPEPMIRTFLMSVRFGTGSPYDRFLSPQNAARIALGRSISSGVG